METSLKTRGIPWSITKPYLISGTSAQPRTGHVLQQFHVKFNDFFDMVQEKPTDLDTPELEWKYLSGFAAWRDRTKQASRG